MILYLKINLHILLINKKSNKIFLLKLIHKKISIYLIDLILIIRIFNEKSFNN